MPGERTQLTPPFPNTSPKGKGGQIDPATGLLIPEEDGGEQPLPSLTHNQPSGPRQSWWPNWFDPEKPPEAELQYEISPAVTRPVRDENGNLVLDANGQPMLRTVTPAKTGMKANPEYDAWLRILLEGQRAGDPGAQAALERLRQSGQSSISTQEYGQTLNLSNLQYMQNRQGQQEQNAFQAGQAAQGLAFDWNKMLAGQDFQKSMQTAQQGFQKMMQDTQNSWQGMENDKNRALEARGLAIQEGSLQEAVRHNKTVETLQARQQIQQAKMENLNMIQGILNNPAVFMMMRKGGFSFAQVSPEYGSLDTIPVPSVGTQQNLARWQAGSQFAQQQYLPGMAPQGAPQAQLGPIPIQLTLGQVMPGVIPSAAGLPAWTPSPHNPQGGPQGSNQRPAGAEALY